MHRYGCKSKLNISAQANNRTGENTYTITIWLEHHNKHLPYYDVTLPSEAAAMIRENLEWTCPNEIAKKVLLDYPSVAAQQIYNAWTTMSETLWKRSPEQLPSVLALLSDFGGIVDILRLPEIVGVEQVAWAMKKVISPLQGKIVEVGMDATCKKTLTHSKLTH